MSAMYEFKRRSKQYPLTIDLDALLAGSTERNIAYVLKMMWRDPKLFEGARVICSTLGLDNGLVMRYNHVNNRTLDTNAWMRLFLHQDHFPNLTSLTLPWTHHTIDFSTITANRLTYLRIVGVRVVSDHAFVGYVSLPKGEAVGNLAAFTRFLRRLPHLNTLIIERGSFEIPPDEQSVPTSFPTLLEMRITSTNLKAIAQMMTHILTPLEWDIATSIRRGPQLTSFVGARVRDYDLVTIDQCATWAFITLSWCSVSGDAEAPRSLLRHKFANDVWFNKTLNVHVARDHVTLAFPTKETPHLDVFSSKCRRLVINRIDMPECIKIPTTIKRCFREDWDYLSTLRTLEHVWIENDCPVALILSKLQPPKRLTVRCVGSPGASEPVDDFAPVLQRWLESDNGSPLITLRGILDSNASPPLEHVLDLRV